MATFNAKKISTKEDTGGKLPGKLDRQKYPFFLMIHPRYWRWHETRGWVPEVSELVISPGVGNTPDARSHAELNPNPAILEHQAKGWVVLMNRDDYLVRWDRERGGWYYTTKFDSPSEYYGRIDWTFDEEGYWDYVCAEAKRLIPAIDSKTIQDKIKIQQKRLDRLEALALEKATTGNLNRVQVEKTKLEAMIATLVSGRSPESNVERSSTLDQKPKASRSK